MNGLHNNRLQENSCLAIDSALMAELKALLLFTVSCNPVHAANLSEKIKGPRGAPLF